MPATLAELPLAVTLPQSVSFGHGLLPQGDRRKGDRRQSVARRPGREQGMALEVLGHAVEYLIDSRMFLTEAPYTKAEQEAVQLLMSASRQVFEDCALIVPLRIQLAVWFQRAFLGRKQTA